MPCTSSQFACGLVCLLLKLVTSARSTTTLLTAFVVASFQFTQTMPPAVRERRAMLATMHFVIGGHPLFKKQAVGRIQNSG